MRTCSSMALVVLLGTTAVQASGSTAGTALDRYLNQPRPSLESFEAFRHLEASTRGGSMLGWVDACTTLDRAGFRYRIVDQGGSSVIRRRVLIAALEEERRVRSGGATNTAEIHVANYTFDAPRVDADGLVRVAIKPRRQEQMLIDGAILIAPESGALTRVEGRLAKRPSFWTRHVDVNREYEPLGNVWVPVRMTSEASVLIVGMSSFLMTYDYLTVNDEPIAARRAESRVCRTDK
jgi:hypothetical protein